MAKKEWQDDLEFSEAELLEMEQSRENRSSISAQGRPRRKTHRSQVLRVPADVAPRKSSPPGEAPPPRKASSKTLPLGVPVQSIIDAKEGPTAASPPVTSAPPRPAPPAAPGAGQPGGVWEAEDAPTEPFLMPNGLMDIPSAEIPINVSVPEELNGEDAVEVAAADLDDGVMTSANISDESAAPSKVAPAPSPSADAPPGSSRELVQETPPGASAPPVPPPAATAPVEGASSQPAAAAKQSPRDAGGEAPAPPEPPVDAPPAAQAQEDSPAAPPERPAADPSEPPAAAPQEPPAADPQESLTSAPQESPATDPSEPPAAAPQEPPAADPPAPPSTDAPPDPEMSAEGNPPGGDDAGADAPISSGLPDSDEAEVTPPDIVPSGGLTGKRDGAPQEEEDEGDTVEIPPNVVQKAMREALDAAQGAVSSQKDPPNSKIDFDIDDPTNPGAQEDLEELSERRISGVDDEALEGEGEGDRANRVAILLSALHNPTEAGGEAAEAQDGAAAPVAEDGSAEAGALDATGRDGDDLEVIEGSDELELVEDEEAEPAGEGVGDVDNEETGGGESQKTTARDTSAEEGGGTDLLGEEPEEARTTPYLPVSPFPLASDLSESSGPSPEALLPDTEATGGDRAAAGAKAKRDSGELEELSDDELEEVGTGEAEPPPPPPIPDQPISDQPISDQAISDQESSDQPLSPFEQVPASEDQIVQVHVSDSALGEEERDDDDGVMTSAAPDLDSDPDGSPTVPLRIQPRDEAPAAPSPAAATQPQQAAAESSPVSAEAPPPPVLAAAPAPTAAPAAAPGDAPAEGSPGDIASNLKLARGRKRKKAWFEEIFDEEWLRTLRPKGSAQIAKEVDYLEESLQPSPSSEILDLGCGPGIHTIEFASRGYQVTGYDLSLPLLIRAADEAQRRELQVNFVHGDFRELEFKEQFDAAFCMGMSFGYFDDDTNRKMIQKVNQSLRIGGRFILDVVNRDYIIKDLPARIWWEGEGSVVLEEVDFNYFTSRTNSKRSVVFEDGRHLEQEFSVRAYSLHELGKILHHAGFRVLEVSGNISHRTRFFGSDSRYLVLLAEKRSQ